MRDQLHSRASDYGWTAIILAMAACGNIEILRPYVTLYLGVMSAMVGVLAILRYNSLRKWDELIALCDGDEYEAYLCVFGTDEEKQKYKLFKVALTAYATLPEVRVQPSEIRRYETQVEGELDGERSGS